MPPTGQSNRPTGRFRAFRAYGYPGHAWLAGHRYSIADAAFTPYVLRLEHLDIMGLLERAPRVVDWYRAQ